MEKLKGAIFDLDGVLVDTAQYHYLAWKLLAEELNIPFSKKDNERLKGVSRMDSLEIILSLGNHERAYSDLEKEKFAAKKNELYIQLIQNLDKSEILPGALELVKKLKKDGIKIALGSASKNAPKIMETTGLIKYFDVIIDGNLVSKAKPHPEVFLKAAKALQLSPKECAVFEDAEAGIKAAKSANSLAIGVGEATNLFEADVVYSSLTKFNPNMYF